MTPRVTTDDTEPLLPLRPLEFSILIALAEADRYGYDIVKRIAEGSGGGVRLAPGNLYQVLDRMIDAGWIEMKRRRDRADERRRYYGVTALGRRVLRAEAGRLEEVLRTARGLEMLPSTRGRA